MNTSSEADGRLAVGLNYPTSSFKMSIGMTEAEARDRISGLIMRIDSSAGGGLMDLQLTPASGTANDNYGIYCQIPGGLGDLTGGLNAAASFTSYPLGSNYNVGISASGYSATIRNWAGYFGDDFTTFGLGTVGTGNVFVNDSLAVGVASPQAKIHVVGDGLIDGSFHITGGLLVDGDISGGATTRGSDSFTTTAQTDTVVIAGAGTGDFYFLQATGTGVLILADALSAEAISGKLVVHRGAAGTSGLTYNWFRIK